ncbi:uncharacterized protein GGS22DRAFT_162512 [Annulohypoxylon maeteangense]|uniref:uncharacterized protein n=1 Tax=Annulohypoxylon maeteangense TaxID=1927788 RepID=UPI0020084464|nr:uncharacterized protein GGS22DRAFT_162512 [Annulohypoxylon maeteangense]KAI0885020.1 hypothetical protein GGS22DRAFT_162512 [Annulohypoxylon maeteangense]
MVKSLRSDFSMEEMWQDATIRFNERTGININIKPPKTLNDCIKELEDTSVPVESSGKINKEKVEEYGLNVLRCLKLLGGVAAQGAEMFASAPSSLCFNALFFLLDIPEQLKSFREAIDGLFETLAPSLGVFRIYERMDQFNEIEPELKQAIHQVMICFVDICALSIQLRDSGKWHKFKSRMKFLMIQDDSGIKAEIEKLDRLTKSHHSIQATQTLKVVLDTKTELTEYLDRESERSQQIATDVSSLKASDDKRNSEDTRRKYVANIRKKLGIEEALFKSFNDMCDKPRRDCVPNTALWLVERPEFQRWAERDEKESETLFVLTGAPNTGKSVMISSLLHHLRSIYESSTRYAPRTLVSAHFFPNTTAKDDQDKRPIATALKCIAIQLAEQDSAYAKSLSQACDGKSENMAFFRDASCKELWDFLRISAPKGSATHYLVLDGLCGLPEESSENREQKEQLLNIIQNSVQPSFRVLLSARQDMLPINDRPSQLNINIEEYNKQDIEKYIEHYLGNNDILQDDEDEPLRTKVVQTLATQVGGNFNKAKAALENIREVIASDGLETEIDRVLEESSMNEKQISKTVISQLEERLTGEEIEELNELLIWVICGRVFFNIDELNAALILRSKRRGTLRLKKKLEGKYSNILKIRKDGRVSVTDDMEETLTKRREKPRSTDDNPTFTATITVTKGDLRSVQSFLWSLSQKVDSLAHDTFGFEKIAEQKGVKNNIQLNEVDACLSLLRRTFSLLANEPNKESGLLGDYLLNYLPQHLEELWEKSTGYDELTLPQKQEIGEGLFSLFVSGEAIERHWASCQSLIFYNTPGEVQIFRRWLDDANVTSSLGRLDREWLKKVKDSSNPNQALLENIMRMVAWHWLCDREWAAVRAFAWLKGFRDMPTQALQEANDTDDGGVINPVSTTVEDVIEWCRGVHPITTDEEKALMNERLGETYAAEGQYSKAIEAYKNSIELANTGWQCLAGLAKALAGDMQYGKACQEMEKALDILNSEEVSKKDVLLSENYSCLAGWQVELEQPKRAIEYAKRAIDLNPDEHRHQFELLKIYLDNDFANDAVNLISEFVKAETPKNEVSLFGQVINDMIYGGRLDSMFAKCFNAFGGNAEIFAVVLQQMDLVIEQSRTDDHIHKTAVLLLYKGIAIYCYGPDEPTRVQKALSCWDQCIGLGKYSGVPGQLGAMSWMCVYYFDQINELLKSESPGSDIFVEKMSDLASQTPALANIDAKTYLASYYARVAKDVPRAREVLQAHIDSAFDVLSDDVEDNDSDGYYALAEVLLYCGDEINSLSAFFLPLPPSPTKDALSWILESESELKQLIGNELIAAVEKNCPTASVDDQLEFSIKRLQEIIGTTDNDEARSPRETPAPGDNTNSSKEPVDTNGNVDSVPSIDNNVIDATQVLIAEDKFKEVEKKAAYEEVLARLNKWSYARENGARRWCDVCSTMWDIDNGMNHCKYCWNIDFCDGCLDKLKAGTLKMTSFETRCNKNHDWLRLPKWDKETYLRGLGKAVYVGEHVDSQGAHIEGREILASEWLDGLKKEWCVKEKAEQAIGGTEEVGGVD